MSTNKETYVFSVKLEEDDYKGFTLFYNFKKIISASVTYFLLILVVFAIYLYEDILSNPVLLLSICSVIDIAACALIAFIRVSVLKLRAKKVYDSNTLLQYAQVYTLGPAGIEVTSESTSGKIKWDEVYRVAETKTTFYIFLSKTQAFIIPKRAFSALEEIEKFLQVLTAHIPKDKIKLIKN